MSDLNSYEEGLAVDLAKAEAVIKAMTEQLEAARADAKEAETYAEELERECKRVADINANHCLTINTYVVDNAKLAAALKEAVEALRGLIQHTHNCEKELTEELHHQDFCGESLPLTKARATLAEIKGESHE
jgi:hydroxypyruvate isomerase